MSKHPPLGGAFLAGARPLAIPRAKGCQEGLGAAGSCEDDSPSRNRRLRGAQRFGDMHSNRNGRLFDDFEVRLA